MDSGTDNRAVSALFRVFGGSAPPVAADAREFARCRGMHAGERAVLAALVPLTAVAAVADGLIAWFGPVAAVLLALPLAFLLLNLLPFALGGKGVGHQWRLWLGACLLWAIFRREGGGVASLFSYIWIGMAVMNSAAVGVLAWRAAGWSGIVWRMLVIVFVHAVALAVGMKWGWHWAILCAACIGMTGCLAVLRPGSQMLGPVRCRTGGDDILITIDDGPDPRDTPRLLDLLDHHRTKAIFFVIGEKARAHPDLVRKIARRGHEIGNHTLSHPQRSFWCAGPWRTWREIAGCQRLIEDITGVAPRWFRAPVGHRNLFTHPVAAALGLGVMAWSRRGYDAVEKDPDKVLERILPGLAAGDIVLVHEATPIAAEVLEGVLQRHAGP